jgi:hypothetical protein
LGATTETVGSAAGAIVSCPVPYYNDTNDVVVHVEISNDNGATLLGNPKQLFFFYIERIQVQIIAAFDKKEALDVFTIASAPNVDAPADVSIVENDDGVPPKFKMLMMSNFTGKGKFRRGLGSTDKFKPLDQQGFVEFNIDAQSTTMGNVVEMWFMSADAKMFVISTLQIDANGAKNLIQGYNNTIDGTSSFFKVACNFQLGHPYRMLIRIIRPGTPSFVVPEMDKYDWRIRTDLYDMKLAQTAQPICSYQQTPYALDATVIFGPKYNVMLTQSNVADATNPNQVRRSLRAADPDAQSMAVNVGRMGVECQPTTCPGGKVQDLEYKKAAEGGNSLGVIIGVVISGIILAIIVVAAILAAIAVARRRRRIKIESEPETEEKLEEETEDRPLTPKKSAIAPPERPKTAIRPKSSIVRPSNENYDVKHYDIYDVDDDL